MANTKRFISSSTDVVPIKYNIVFFDWQIWSTFLFVVHKEFPVRLSERRTEDLKVPLPLTSGNNALLQQTELKHPAGALEEWHSGMWPAPTLSGPAPQTSIPEETYTIMPSHHFMSGSEYLYSYKKKTILNKLQVLRYKYRIFSDEFINITFILKKERMTVEIKNKSNCRCILIRK